MYERMLHTPLELYPSSSIYPPLFSGHKYDRHGDPSHDQVVYEEEKKLGYCDTGWSLSSTPSPTTLPLKLYPGPHEHYKIVKI